MSIECPLCCSGNSELVQRISCADVEILYRKVFGLDVHRLLSNGTDGFILLYRCVGCDLRFFSPLIVGNEEFYNALQKYEWYYMDEKPEYEFAKRYIRDDDTVLEIGSGKGALAKLLPTRNYVGLEFSVEAKRLAEKNGIKILNESIQEHAKNNQEKYSVVCSFQVLEHVSAIKDFLKSAVQAVQENGILILAVPAHDGFLRHVVNGILNVPPHHVSHWSDMALKNIATVFGLEVVEIYHEAPAPIHKQQYVATIINSCLRKWLRMPYRVIDLTLLGRLCQVVSGRLSQLGSWGLLNGCRQHGHTVSIVLRKSKRI